MKNLILSCCKKMLSVVLIVILLLSTISGEVWATDLKVSIIIPVYNTPENLLRDCLNSAKNQTLKDIEIICVDDGSTDGSGKILDEYAKNDSRFVVVHQENGGCAVARNRGLDLAKGEYIQFVDSDDTIDRTMSEKCYNKAKEFDADIVKCNYTYECNWTRHCNINKLITSQTFNFEVHGFIWNGIWKRIFPKGDKLYFPINSRRRPDELLNLKFIPRASRIVYFSEKLYHYTNQNMNSITHFYHKQKKDELKFIANNIKHIYEDWKEQGYLNNDIAKMRLLEFVVFADRTSRNCDSSVDNKCKMLINAIGSELLQDNVINQLPTKERMQLRQIIQKAKEV